MREKEGGELKGTEREVEGKSRVGKKGFEGGQTPKYFGLEPSLACTADIDRYLEPALSPAPGLQKSCCCSGGIYTDQMAAAIDGTGGHTNRHSNVT